MVLGRFRKTLPGIIAGAADLDPAAVLTATVAGAAFGLSIGWVVLLCIPILQAFIGTAARIGHEQNKGLVRLVRDHHGRRSAITLALMVVMVNTIMIVADLMAVSEALSLILDQPRRYFPAIVAFVVWGMLTLGQYARLSRILGVLALFLLAYMGAAIVVTDDVWTLVRGILTPRIPMSTAYVLGVVAVFGSLLTPDILIWQTSSRGEVSTSSHDWESRAGCVVASAVSLSVIIAASAMMVPNPASMSTPEAARALSAFGEWGPLLFAVGILGSGLVALPILVASMCYAIAEAAGWSAGLSKPPWEARNFFVLITLVLVGAVACNLVGFNTIRVLYLSQIVAGVVVVPLMFFVLRLANDERVVSTINTRWQNFWLGGAIGGMTMANLIAIWLEWVQPRL